VTIFGGNFIPKLRTNFIFTILYSKIAGKCLFVNGEHCLTNTIALKCHKNPLSTCV
jgi:hypothetical protein